MSRKIEVQVIGDAKSLEAALGRAQKKTSTFGKAVNVGAKVGEQHAGERHRTDGRNFEDTKTGKRSGAALHCADVDGRLGVGEGWRG